MDRKAIDSRKLSMHAKFHDVSTALHRANVASIKILLDFITVLFVKNLKGCSVMTLVDVLVDILDSIHRGTYLDIDMAVVSAKHNCQTHTYKLDNLVR